MYRLYKRAAVGRLSSKGMDDNDLDDKDGDGDDKEPLESDCSRPSCRPSAWNIVARYECDTWAECNILTLSEARMEYVGMAAAQDNRAGRECVEMLERFEEEV